MLNLTFGISTGVADVPVASIATPSVYPNPTNGLLTPWRPMGRRSWALRSSTSPAASRCTALPASSRIDLTPLPAGTYLVRMQTPQGIATHRVVKW
ncbi:MAG: T9SS type A sorting domain-containing protein [Flavobacteriales bacterium]|nr:T9SS type A sorting domain-containing protein [Flavobacteriales bacterium]